MNLQEKPCRLTLPEILGLGLGPVGFRAQSNFVVVLAAIAVRVQGFGLLLGLRHCVYTAMYTT